VLRYCVQPEEIKAIDGSKLGEPSPRNHMVPQLRWAKNSPGGISRVALPNVFRSDAQCECMLWVKRFEPWRIGCLGFFLTWMWWIVIFRIYSCGCGFGQTWHSGKELFFNCVARNRMGLEAGESAPERSRLTDRVNETSDL